MAVLDTDAVVADLNLTVPALVARHTGGTRSNLTGLNSAGTGRGGDRASGDDAGREDGPAVFFSSNHPHGDALPNTGVWFARKSDLARRFLLYWWNTVSQEPR